jgi:hypothetical protein
MFTQVKHLLHLRNFLHTRGENMCLREENGGDLGEIVRIYDMAYHVGTYTSWLLTDNPRLTPDESVA